jgi:hypothetical protein
MAKLVSGADLASIETADHVLVGGVVARSLGPSPHVPLRVLLAPVNSRSRRVFVRRMRSGIATARR